MKRILIVSLFVGASAFAQSPVAQSSRPNDVRIADSLLDTGHFEDARRAYLDLTKGEPQVGRHWYRLGLAEYRLNRIADAAAAFDRGARIGQNPMAQYNAAAMYAKLGKSDTAFAFLKLAAPSGMITAAQIEGDADFASIRADRRYREIVDAATRASEPCALDPMSRQLDFWIGEWDVKTKNGQPAGKSSIQRVSGGCALLENWTDPRGGTGKSLNAFNKARQSWQQFWVGQGGQVTEYRDGKLRDSSMVFLADGVTPTGAAIKQRLTFTPLAGGIVRQFGESSTDGGTTWSPSYELFYHPRR